LILMIFIAFGVKTKTIDNIRIKYRPYLRIIAGILIIVITLYSIWDIII
jgi:cytochrome c biogenesis protein CcdA